MTSQRRRAEKPVELPALRRDRDPGIDADSKKLESYHRESSANRTACHIEQKNTKKH